MSSPPASLLAKIMESPSPPSSPFSSEGHSSRLLNQMGSLRQGKQLCDVILKVGSKEIPAHRLVLSACSPYFCAMFTNQMLESQQNYVTLTDLDGQTVEEIVDFAYTGEITIHEDNVQPLLKAASILQLCEVVSACCAFLSSQLHASNSLGIATFAQAHGCTWLEHRAMEYVQDHFMEVVEGEEFVQVSVEHMLKLMASEQIHVPSEEFAFEAMYKWLHHNLQARRHHAAALLRYIRLPLLRPVYLVDAVYSKEVFQHDAACMELIMNALVYVSVKEKRPHLKAKVNISPRKSTLGTLFVVGGMDTCRNKVSIECFDARKERWVLLQNSHVTFKRLQFGVAILNSHIYIVGGRNGLLTLNTVDCFDSVANTWISVPPMCSYRHGVSVATLSGPLYAVGGHDGWSYLSSVERYVKASLFNSIAISLNFNLYFSMSSIVYCLGIDRMWEEQPRFQ